MGQEASLPQDGRTAADAELEEQARAPPSSIYPPGTHPSHANSSSNNTSKDKRKFLFQRAKDGAGRNHLNNSNNHTSTTDHYEHREAARAAAAGGNLYVRQESDEYALQKMPSDGSSLSYGRPPPPPPAETWEPQQVGPHSDLPLQQHPSSQYALYGGHSQTQQQSQSHHRSSAPKPEHDASHNTPSKKGLFPGRSARGMINSMRNLSIGRKQKEVHDWEKQWDDDDDEDDEEDADHADGGARGQHHHHYQPHEYLSPHAPPPATALPAVPRPGLQRPGMDAGHSVPAVTASVVAPNTPPSQKSTPPNKSLPTTATAPDSNMNTSPLRPQHHSYPTAPVPVSPQPDFLSSSTPWEATATPPGEPKPDVQMFLPMLRVLGKGSFGKVVLVQKREGKERGQLFAMKILRKTHLVKRRQIERTRTERKVLSVVNHPFIMKLHYAFQTHDKLYLVLDYCPGGELFFHLSRFRRFPERVARFYAAELLLAMGHLHKRGIIYRDLKPENVLLDADGHVKLGDFGLAKAGIQHPYEGATSMCGTPEYMAPEVLCQQGHGFCVDYWGLGMIVYEMMTGLPPWYTTDRQQLFRRLKSAPLDIPSYFSVSSAECVTALLERNPRRRLGVTGIRTAMEHDFFRNISWRALYSRRVEAPVRPCEGWKPPEAVKDGRDAEDSKSKVNGRKEFYEDGVEKLDNSTLDTATQNFDAQFTRMPVDSVDRGNNEHPDELDLMEDLDESTFLGFSFDIISEKDKAALAAGVTPSPQQASASRQRTSNQSHTLDS